MKNFFAVFRIMLALAVLFISMASLVSCSPSTIFWMNVENKKEEIEIEEKKKSDLLARLQEMYGKEFVISEKLDSGKYSYLVYPAENDKIVFEAGFETSNVVFPFLPPSWTETYSSEYDEYREALKRYWLEGKNTVWILEDTYKWNRDILDEIYDIMAYLNEQLENEGISTTDYTSSFEATLIIKGEEHIVKFNKQDRGEIDNVIRAAYKQEDITND